MKIKRNLDWATMLEDLEAFQEEYGHLRVEEEGRRHPVLAGWWSDVRRGLGRLTYEQICDLDRLGFFPALDQRWLDRYAQVMAFKERAGHCRVPKPEHRNSTLANWVQFQRKQADTMIPWRRKLLVEVGFDWDPNATYWRARYEDLLEFKREHGHTDVPSTWEENPELAHWVIVQRHQRANPTREQIALLVKAGFNWEPHETAWMQRYEELTAFRAKHGHCRPRVDTSDLGKWVHKQRNMGKKMPRRRKELLNRIGFCWGEKIDDAWLRQYEELKAYYRKHGHGPPQRDLLGRWVSNQRTAHRKGTMPPEREKLLNKIGFVWRVFSRG